MIDRFGSRGRWWLAGPLVIGLVVACSPAGETDLRGIWNTRSIGGDPVPGWVEYGSDSVETAYARWAFYDNAACTLTQLVNLQVQTFDRCTYTLNAEDRTFAVQVLSGEWEGTAQGTSMRLVDPLGVVWELEAQ